MIQTRVSFCRSLRVMCFSSSENKRFLNYHPVAIVPKNMKNELVLQFLPQKSPWPFEDPPKGGWVDEPTRVYPPNNDDKLLDSTVPIDRNLLPKKIYNAEKIKLHSIFRQIGIACKSKKFEEFISTNSLTPSETETLCKSDSVIDRFCQFCSFPKDLAGEMKFFGKLVHEVGLDSVNEAIEKLLKPIPLFGEDYCVDAEHPPFLSSVLYIAEKAKLCYLFQQIGLLSGSVFYDRHIRSFPLTFDEIEKIGQSQDLIDKFRQICNVPRDLNSEMKFFGKLANEVGFDAVDKAIDTLRSDLRY